MTAYSAEGSGRRCQLYLRMKGFKPQLLVIPVVICSYCFQFVAFVYCRVPSCARSEALNA